VAPEVGVHSSYNLKADVYSWVRWTFTIVALMVYALLLEELT